MVLFQAFKDALEESKGKFITISSGVGTITQDMYPGMGVYGATKVCQPYPQRDVVAADKIGRSELCGMSFLCWVDDSIREGIDETDEKASFREP